MTLYPATFYFKTSYVEVYRSGFSQRSIWFWFQNILCWSLSVYRVLHSRDPDISKHLMLKFISNWTERSIRRYDFKTSYVEVYLAMSKFKLIFNHNFKTSYVEVYLRDAVQTVLAFTNFKTSYVEVYPYLPR